MNTDEFWNFYWETRLRYLQGQGKSEVILQASRLIRDTNPPARILESGCGEAQIIGALVDAHGKYTGDLSSVGIDRDTKALAVARQQFPSIDFLEGDFTDSHLLHSLGKFDLLLLVNALHHVFSDAYDPKLEEINVSQGKAKVRFSFANLANTLNPGGYLILFDGLEAGGLPETTIEVRFKNTNAWQKFRIFAHEYKPFKIQYEVLPNQIVQLSLRDFTRYVTKIIFLGKPLWERERHESYQYFNETEMCQMLTENNFEILEFRLLSVDYDHWLQEVEILTPAVDFPPEHAIITAKKNG